MKKNRFAALFVVALICMLSIPIYAYNLPAAEVKDGNTYLGTFKMADQKDSYQKTWDDWKHSDRNVMIAGDKGYEYYFFTVPDDANLTIEDFSNHNGNFLNVHCSKVIDGLKFRAPAGDLNNIEFQEMWTLPAGSMVAGAKYAVCGTYFNNVNYKFPSISYDCFIDFEGTLILVDDIDGEMSQEEKDSGLIGWIKKILDWLKNFFKKLKDMFISLFVPRDGFFHDWFNEIKSAFEDKLGGLGAVFDTMKNAFENIASNNFSLKITIKPNSLYAGYPGFSIDLMYYASPFFKFLRPILTGILLIVTAITCYKRLAAFTRT